jgi:anti-sigma factor RsiW
MSHLDEGTLHALLDGELDLAEISEVQKHLGSCIACGSRLQEVKQVLAEADRLVGAMELPAAAPHSRPESPPPPPQFRAREPAAWDEPPVLLVPDPIDASARRKRLLRGLRWAAGIAVVLIGGRLAAGALRPSHPVLPERDLTSAAPAVPPAVVSPEEARAPQPRTPQPSVALKARGERPQTRAPAQRAPARPAPVVQERVDETADRFADSAADSAPTEIQDSIPGDTETLAAEAMSDTVAAEGKSDTLAGAPAAGAAETLAAGAAGEPADDRSDEDQQLATRRAAAAALAELDRERRRQRANAATAALPPARPEVANEEAAPRPLTLEQRAQIYLRIGLDEAVKHLGGPVHVIEGMTPEFIGLTRAQLIPGTTSNRPVVRVVYLDARGRLILLDQQRMAPGQPPLNSAGSLRWTIGDVMLYLRGEPSTEVLRGLQARVR